jgi:oligopeptide transport system permease protein
MAVTAPASTRTTGTGSPEIAMRKERSLWSDAWRRLRRNRAAVLGMIVIAIFAILAIFAGVIAKDPTLNIVPGNGYRPPFWVDGPGEGVRQNGSLEYPLGSDKQGRDLLSRLVYGARVSLVVGVIPTTIIVIVGLIIGLTAGYAGGRTDNLLMRFTDVIYAFPDLLFLIIVMSAFREAWIGRFLGGMLLMFFALSIISWTGMARLIRGQVLSVKEKEFIESARAIGSSRFRIMTRHLLPNILAPIIVSITFGIPGAILAEAALGFLGVGLRPQTPGTPSPFPTSWGILIQEGYAGLNSSPWILLWSALAIGLITMSFAFLGDGLRDALDPRQKQ